MPKLKNAKYEAFCNEYVVDRNGAQSAIRAGYSAKTANSKAAQLLTIVSIQERINELESEIQKRNEVTVDWLLNWHVQNMKSTPDEYVEGGGMLGVILKQFDEMPEDKKQYINKVSFKKGHGTDFSLVSKMESAKEVGKIIGAYKEKEEVEKQSGEIDWTKLSIDERINLLELIKKAQKSE